MSECGSEKVQFSWFKMATYDAYLAMGFIVPFVILNSFYFCSLIYILVYLKRSTKETRGVRLPRLIRLALESMFEGLEMDPETKEESPQYFKVCLHGKRLSKWSVIGFVCVVLTVFGCSIATLWSVTVIRESPICGGEHYDCFSNEKKVADCDMFENGTRVTINGTEHNLECYRFVFDYVGGLAAAGGVTFFARIVINTLVFIVAWIFEIKNHYLRSLLLLVLPFLLLGANVGFIILNSYLLADDTSIPTLFTFLVYTVTFTISLFTYIVLEIDLFWSFRQGFSTIQ